MRVPFYRVKFEEDDFAAVRAVMESGWLTTAKVAKEFEAELAKYTGAKHALAVNSCTSALWLVLRAMREKKASKTVNWRMRNPVAAVPTWTFVATATAAQHAGYDVVFVDCEPGTLNMDLDHLERLLEKHTIDVVIPVHFAGESVDMARLKKIASASKSKPMVLEDCAHSIGTFVDGKHSGTFGDAGAFSFYATKNITSGEGGAVITDDDFIAEWVRKARNHGLGSAAADRYTSGSWVKPTVEAEGYKMNFPDVLAAIGLQQLRKLPSFVKARQDLASVFDAQIGGVCTMLDGPFVRTLQRSSNTCPHLYVVVFDDRVDRDAVANKMAEQGVEVQMHYVPVHLHPWWQTRAIAPDHAELKNAAKMNKKVLTLPFWIGMPAEMVARTFEVLEDALR